MNRIIKFIEGYFIAWFYIIGIITILTLLYMLFTWDIPFDFLNKYLINLTFFKVVNGICIITGIFRSLE